MLAELKRQAQERFSAIGTIFGRRWPKFLLGAWAVLGAWDLFVSQLVPPQIAERIPKAYQVIAMSGDLMTLWSWLFIGAILIALISFEYGVRQNSKVRSMTTKSQNANVGAVYSATKANVALYTLGRRQDELKAIAIVESRGVFYLASNWKPAGPSRGRIRVDARGLDGAPIASFGASGNGLISFGVADHLHSEASRLTVLNDGSILVTGTVSNNDDGSSTGFLAKVALDGSLDGSFGIGGILPLPSHGQKTRGYDTAQIDGNLLCAMSAYERPDLIIAKVNMENGEATTHSLRIAESGTVWPTRIVRAFPEHSVLVAGKTVSDIGASDGFLLKIEPSLTLSPGYGENGIVRIQQTFQVPLVHQIVGITALPDGGALIAGTGNEGFVAAVNATGRPLLTFGRAGLYEAQSRHRTTAASLAWASEQTSISLAGMESDGNSITLPFKVTLDLYGREMTANIYPIFPSEALPAGTVDHLIMSDGTFAALVTEPGGHRARQSYLAIHKSA